PLLLLRLHRRPSGRFVDGQARGGGLVGPGAAHAERDERRERERRAGAPTRWRSHATSLGLCCIHATRPTIINATTTTHASPPLTPQEIAVTTSSARPKPRAMTNARSARATRPLARGQIASARSANDATRSSVPIHGGAPKV